MPPKIQNIHWYEIICLPNENVKIHGPLLEPQWNKRLHQGCRGENFWANPQSECLKPQPSSWCCWSGLARNSFFGAKEDWKAMFFSDLFYCSLDIWDWGTYYLPHKHIICTIKYIMIYRISSRTRYNTNAFLINENPSSRPIHLVLLYDTSFKRVCSTTRFLSKYWPDLLPLSFNPYLETPLKCLLLAHF